MFIIRPWYGWFENCNVSYIINGWIKIVARFISLSLVFFLWIPQNQGILRREDSSLVTKHAFKACLGNVLREESSLVFLNSEENPGLGEEGKSERRFSKSSKPIKNPPFHWFLRLDPNPPPHHRILQIHRGKETPKLQKWLLLGVSQNLECNDSSLQISL